MNDIELNHTTRTNTALPMNASVLTSSVLSTDLSAQKVSDEWIIEEESESN